MDGFISKDIVMGPDGKPRFIGRDLPTKTTVTKREPGTQMQCPVCNGWFDYLVGEDTPDGGRRGCEACWKPSQKGVNNYDESVEEIIG